MTFFVAGSGLAPWCPAATREAANLWKGGREAASAMQFVAGSGLTASWPAVTREAWSNAAPVPLASMRLSRRACLLIAAILTLAGCATHPIVEPGPAASGPEVQAARVAREAALAAQRDWGLDGRVAVSSDGQGGSARIEWRQQGSRFDVTVSAPITRQSWRLSGEPGHARIDGLAGGPREGVSAQDLLMQATGWTIPVDSLVFWLRGRAAPGGGGESVFDRDGRLTRLQQSGWTIDYEWPAATQPASAQPILPVRIDARRATARVRLAVDHWLPDATTP